MEVVVSDNAPTEQTARVIEKHRAVFPGLRYCLQTHQRVEPYVGFINAVRNATGRYVIYLADDDTVLPEALWEHVERLEGEPGLSAIFADWMAYDDEQEKELHRYYNLAEPARFGPDDPMKLVNFVLGNAYFPDMGIYRRTALLQCDCLIDRGVYQYHLWMYLLARLGTIMFHPTPFYRENRVLKQRFKRGTSNNLLVRLEWIGDEMRSVVETLLLWALQDCGYTQVPADQMLAAKTMIDRYLHARVDVEIHRAIDRRNWLLALALRRRRVLWYGPGAPELYQAEGELIVLPAVLQAVREMCGNLSDVSGLALEGFVSRQVHDFYKAYYPELKLLDPGDPGSFPLSGRAVYLCRNRLAGAERGTDGYRYYLDVLLGNYRLNKTDFDLRTL